MNLQDRSGPGGKNALVDLDASRVLVTGGTSGVGRELVAQLSAAGARVVTCGRSPDRCDSLRLAHPDVVVIEADLAVQGRGRELVDAALGHLGGLDVVINNAGVQYLEDYVSGATDELISRAAVQVNTNLTSPVEITAAALPALVQSAAPRIVFVTSGLGVYPKKTAPVYCATKSALRSLAVSLRYQMEDSVPHVKIVDVVLPLVDTPMTAGRGKESDKMSPADVARRIIASLASPRPVVFVGKARLLPLLMRLAPSLGARILRNG